MLTVVIPTHNSAGDLQVLLSALVPAAVDGLVRQVVVVDASSTDNTAEICDDAGADLVGSLDEAGRKARNDRVLVLPVDIRLKPGWDAALGAHLVRGGKPAILQGERDGWLKAVKTGVLVKPEALSGAGDLAAVRRKLGPAPVKL